MMIAAKPTAVMLVSDSTCSSAVNFFHQNVTSRICAVSCKLMQECALFGLALAPTNT